MRIISRTTSFSLKLPKIFSNTCTPYATRCLDQLCKILTINKGGPTLSLKISWKDSTPSWPRPMLLSVWARAGPSFLFLIEKSSTQKDLKKTKPIFFRDAFSPGPDKSKVSWSSNLNKLSRTARIQDQEFSLSFGKAKPTILILYTLNSSQSRSRAFWDSLKEARALTPIPSESSKRKLRMLEFKLTTTADIFRPLDNFLLSWLMILRNFLLCLKFSLRSCTPSSRFTNSASFTTLLLAWLWSSRKLATRSFLELVNTSTEVWWLRLWAQEQNKSLMFAEDLKQRSMCAQNSRNIIMNTRPRVKANGNLLSMLYSQDLMPTVRDAMIFSISQLLSCSSIN